MARLNMGDRVGRDGAVTVIYQWNGWLAQGQLSY